MITAEDIIKGAGCSADQLERWIKEGWMPCAQGRLPQPHQRGPGIGLYPEDGLDRARFFMEALAANRDMIEAGYELFLQGRHLYKGQAIREVLLRHAEYLEQHLREQITIPADLPPAEARKEIAAELRRDPGPFNAHGQALIGLSARMFAGATRKRAGADPLESLEPDLPPVSIHQMKACIMQAHKVVVLRAAQQINERLAHERESIAAVQLQFQNAFHITPDDQPRFLLPWHRCLSNHDMPAVLRPYYTILELMPKERKHQLAMLTLIGRIMRWETKRA